MHVIKKWFKDNQQTIKLWFNIIMAFIVGYLVIYYLGYEWKNIDPHTYIVLGQFVGVCFCFIIAVNVKQKWLKLLWCLMGGLVNRELLQDYLNENFKPTSEDYLVPLVTAALMLYGLSKIYNINYLHPFVLLWRKLKSKLLRR